MASIPGSVRFTGFIAPTDSTDTYPVTDPTWGLGGLRKVTSISDRDNITTDRREAGMFVYVQNEDTYYKLNSGLTNSDWEPFDVSPNLLGYNETGSRVGGDILVGLADYDSSGNGTRIIIDDANQSISLFSSDVDVTLDGGEFNIQSGVLIVTENDITFGVDVSATDINSSGTITADFFVGDGSQLSGITSGALPSNVAYTNINNPWTVTQNFINATSQTTATQANELVRYDQLTSLIGGLDWQEPVINQIDFTTSEPASPTIGDRYISTTTGISNITSQSVTINYITEWDGTDWIGVQPQEGWTVWDKTADTNFTFNGTNWVEFGSTVSHNNTTGLQGGLAGEYYHLNEAQYTALISVDAANIAFRNVNNNFTVAQTFQANVTAPTFIGNVLTNQITAASATNINLRNNAGLNILTLSDSRNATFSGGVVSILRTGSASPHADTDLLVGDSTAVGSTAQIQIYGGTSANSNLYFSDVDAYSVGGFNYNHSTDTLNIRANNTTLFSINNSLITASRVIQSNNGFSTGPNAATSGWIRLENQDTITSRNAQNSGNRTLMYLDASNVVQFSVSTDSNFGGGVSATSFTTTGLVRGQTLEATSNLNIQQSSGDNTELTAALGTQDYNLVLPAKDGTLATIDDIGNSGNLPSNVVYTNTVQNITATKNFTVLQNFYSDVSILGVVTNTNNSNAAGNNFTVSTTNKAVNLYAYGVERNGDEYGITVIGNANLNRLELEDELVVTNGALTRWYSDAGVTQVAYLNPTGTGVDFYLSGDRTIRLDSRVGNIQLLGNSVNWQLYGSGSNFYVRDTTNGADILDLSNTNVRLNRNVDLNGSLDLDNSGSTTLATFTNNNQTLTVYADAGGGGFFGEGATTSYTGWYINGDEANFLQSGTGRHVFEADGRVGINTTNPSSSYLLDVTGSAIFRGSVNVTEEVTWGNGRNIGNSRNLIMGYSGAGYGGFGYGIEYTTTTGVHNYTVADRVTRADLDEGIVIYSASAGTIGNPITWVETFRAIGREATARFKGEHLATQTWVGDNFAQLSGDNIAFTNVNNIFTTSQTINGTLTMATASDQLMDLQSTDVGAYIRLRDNQDSLYIGTNNGRGFFGGTTTTSTPNLVIDLSSGSVGIGGIPLQKLHVHAGHLLIDNNYEIRMHASNGTTQHTVMELNSLDNFMLGGSYSGNMEFIGAGYNSRGRLRGDNGRWELDTIVTFGDDIILTTGEIFLSNNKGIIATQDGVNRDLIKVNSANNVEIGSSVSTNDTLFKQTGAYIFSGGLDILSDNTDGYELLRFSTDSRDWVFRQKGSGSGTQLELRSLSNKDYYISSTATVFRSSLDDSNHLTLNHSGKIATFVGDIIAGGSVRVGDWDGVGNSIRVGDGLDLSIYHDGTNNYIQSNNGNIYHYMGADYDHIFIQNGTTKVIVDSQGLHATQGFSARVTDSNRLIEFQAPNNEKRFYFYVGGTGNDSYLQMYQADGTTIGAQIQSVSTGYSYFTSGLLVGTGSSNGGYKFRVVGNTELDGSVDIEGNLSVDSGITITAQQLIGGIGAHTTSGVLDWDDVTNSRSGSGYTLLLGNATNGHGGSGYYHPFNFEYASKNGSGNIFQFAIPYGGTESQANKSIYYRTKYNGTWANWQRMVTEDNIIDIADGNFVTINTTQTVTGNKTFSANTFVTGRLSVGHTGTPNQFSVHAGTSSDISRFQNDNGSIVFGHTANLASIDLGTAQAFRIRQGSSIPIIIGTSGHTTLNGFLYATQGIYVGDASNPNKFINFRTDTNWNYIIEADSNDIWLDDNDGTKFWEAKYNSGGLTKSLESDVIFKTYRGLYSLSNDSGYDPVVLVSKEGSEGLEGLRLFYDRSVGNIYYDHQNNSGSTGHIFRNRTSATTITALSLVNGNATFGGNITANQGFFSGNAITFTNDAASGNIYSADTLILHADYNGGESNKSIIFNVSQNNVASIDSGGVNINGRLYLNADSADSSARIDFYDSNSPVGYLGYGTQANGALSWVYNSSELFRSDGTNFTINTNLKVLDDIYTDGDQLILQSGGLSGTKITIDDALDSVTINSNVTANSFIKSGGTSSQFLMADGSVSTGSGVSLSDNNNWTGVQYQTPTVLTDGATITWNLNNQKARVTLAGNRTFLAPTNIREGATYTLTIRQDGVGNRTATWTAGYDFGVDGPPTLSTGPNLYDILVFEGGISSLLFIGIKKGFFDNFFP